MFFISKNIKNNFSNFNYILLDTGSSLTGRKYLNEIIDIFKDNKNIPYKLIVKTVPTVYKKNNLKKKFKL